MTDNLGCKTQLVVRSTFDQFSPIIEEAFSKSAIIGLDLETHNEDAHAGIKKYRGKEDTDAFDWRKMTICGLSVYPDGHDTAYYFNLGHCDVEEQIPWEWIEKLLNTKPKACIWVCHNAPFELTVLQNSVNYTLQDCVCTMQMCVSAYGPDEYDSREFIRNNLSGINQLFKEAVSVFADFNPKGGRFNMTAPQLKLFNQAAAKQSFASHSYPGMIYEISYGYGLKKAIKSHFGVEMTTYEQALQGKAHMGLCTSEQIAAYGADDSYWAVQLFIFLLNFMRGHCPNAISSFFTQENPMVQVYSDLRVEGLKVNAKAVENRTDLERKAFAKALRLFKAAVKDLLPFPENKNEKLSKYDKWYADGYEKYRARLIDWVNSPDEVDDLKQVCQISSAVGNAWAGKKIEALNLTHYYQSRLFMYDLTPVEPIIYKGKVQSDAESRGVVREKLDGLRVDNPSQNDYLDKCDLMLKLMGEMASIEQRMKLYLTPYQLLTDPETQRMYPEVSSKLATRRMAGSNPNTMQLAKRGESTYVRGFFLPDNDDEVLISLDWSQVELVLVGEFSGDAEFAKAYGQLPYQDLHLGATADLLSLGQDIVISEEFLTNLHKMEAKDVPDFILRKPNGDTMLPKEAKKFWRTTLGKGANFSYWYSGALSTPAEMMGWTADQMWAASDIYRQRFAVAEAWRVKCISDARDTGYIELPDGHRRYRYEATYEWMNWMQKLGESWNSPGVNNFIQAITKAITSRAGNQIVNAMIQGSAAALAKKSILEIRKKLEDSEIRAKFKITCHDELIYSVHKNDVLKFINLAKSVMMNQPSIVKNLKLHCTTSVGLTFEPWDAKKAPYGQIELDECPEIDCIPKEYHGGVIPDEYVFKVIEFLYARKMEQ